ncbi:MAG TPA: membrane dipeptidase [Bryobacteraceae bacterium]|nr:membrane dipeptidase [Bryobacteraceae bacterium]
MIGRKLATTRRQALAAGAALLAAPFFNRGRYRLFAQSADQYSERAVRLVRESLVIDMLNQFLYRADQREKLRAWLTRPGAFTNADFQRFRDSGINAINFGDGANTYEDGIRLFADWNSFIAQYPDWLLRIGTGSDFMKAKTSGRYGILFGLQNSAHFRRAEDVDTFYGLGQRVSQVTYNFRNLIGNGAFEPHDDGISEFGSKIIERMNQVGMVVDCGHAGDRTMLDAFSMSKQTVIISHGNCRALNPGHPRCVTDEAIRAMAKQGGVMGINFISFMVKDHEPTTVDDVIDHIDHVSQLVGIEHVGIGSDMGIESNDLGDPKVLQQILTTADKRYRVHHRETVAHLDHQKRTYDLTEGLIRRRYTDEQIRLILGENWRRVLTGIWNTRTA